MFGTIRASLPWRQVFNLSVSPARIPQVKNSWPRVERLRSRPSCRDSLSTVLAHAAGDDHREVLAQFAADYLAEYDQPLGVIVSFAAYAITEFTPPVPGASAASGENGDGSDFSGDLDNRVT